MDLEQAAHRLARRRRRGRMVGIALVPAGLLVLYVVVTWDDGPPSTISLLALAALAAAVSVGWWWLERQARGAAPAGCSPRPWSEPTPSELDDARAEVALRTCSPPPPGGRARLEALVARRSRDARKWRWAGPGYLALAVALAVSVVLDDEHGVPWPMPLFWTGFAVVGLAQARRNRRLVRRWVAAHGSVEVAGAP